MNMKKIMLGCLMILCIAVFSFAAVNKEDFFAKMSMQYAGLENMSGKYEINMQMMGTTMKIPVRFWKKGDRMRMDMEVSQPGISKPWESVMLIDKGKMIQYQKTLNMVMTVDMSKLPENMARQMNQQQLFMLDDKTINSFKQTMGNMDNFEVEEKIKGGKDFYLVTIRDIDKMGNVMPMSGGQNSQQFFKKALLWICRDSLLPEKMEFYGDAETPGMWIDFLEIKTDSIADSVFDLDIPADAKVMDMTESIRKMAESMGGAVK